jgi:hypothetical protein
MEVQEIEVHIDPDGQVRIEVSGVNGPACLELTHDLEQALGGQIELRQMKADSYAETDQETENHLNLRTNG